MICNNLFKNILLLNKFFRSLTDKIPKKNFYKENFLYFFCFSLTVSFYKVGKQPCQSTWFYILYFRMCYFWFGSLKEQEKTYGNLFV